MAEQTQQEYLKTAKAALGLEWDDFAEKAGIKPRAFKTYRMPSTSTDFRALPSLARRSIDRLLADHQEKIRGASSYAHEGAKTLG